MVLLLLGSGELAQVPYAVDVIRREGWLVCVGPDDEPLAAVGRNGVLAYTLNQKVVQEMVHGRQVRTLLAGTGLA